MPPRETRSGRAPGASTSACGRATVSMLSWMTPTFSKMPRTVCMTQPDMARMRMTRASPAAASPPVIRPRDHKPAESAAIEHSSRLFMTARIPVAPVMRRSTARNVWLLRSSASRTAERSASPRANSLTVRMLV